MPDQPLQSPSVQQAENISIPADQTRLAPIAAVWHTIVLVAVILLNSYASRSVTPEATSSRARLALYATTFVIQVAIVLFIWFGISRKGFKMRELIGGRWSKPEDFLIDVGIAIVFWIVSTVLRTGLAIALHLVDLHNPQGQINQVKQAVGSIAPQNWLEVACFVVLVVFAGIFEEIIFRGYLQRQIGALARNIWVGVIVSAIIFGAGHGYQGTRYMTVIGIYGAMFGLLAVLRKNLRPGMIAHAGQDALSGVLYFVMTKNGIL